MKAPKTHPYKQGQVDLKSPDPFKNILNWLEYQSKTGDIKSPIWGHQLYHARPGEFTELRRLLVISWRFTEVVRLKNAKPVCNPGHVVDEKERNKCHDLGWDLEQRNCITLFQALQYTVERSAGFPLHSCCEAAFSLLTLAGDYFHFHFPVTLCW